MPWQLLIQICPNSQTHLDVSQLFCVDILSGQCITFELPKEKIDRGIDRQITGNKMRVIDKEEVNDIYIYIYIYTHKYIYIYIYIYIYVYIYHIYQPLRSGRIWHKVNFKRILTGFNSEFSFSQTSCLTKAEEHSLSYYLPHSWRENNWIHTFPKGISAMWNAISLVQDLNSCRRVHFFRG